MEPRVHVVILNWNGFGDTSRCLRSLQHLRYLNYRVIVVDNGSTDDSESRIVEQFPGIELTQSGKNLGFAGGCNVGIRQALAEGTDFIWLLNSDTTVDPAALEALVDKIDTNPRIGAVGSAIYFMDEPHRLQAWGGGYVNFWLGRSGHFFKPVPDPNIQFLTGASLLISRSAVEAIGLLDEDFFMYWEDADFCFRLRRAGWNLAVAGESKVWHKGYTSIGRGRVSSYQYFNASASLFFKKYAPVPVFSFWFGFALRLAKRILAGDWEKTRAVWAGIARSRVAP